MSKSTLPRFKSLSGYCWAEHPGGGLHCCLPMGHTGKHYHPYTRTNF